MAVIDGDFLAALPQEDPAADFSRFAPVSVALRPDQLLLIADGGSQRIWGLPLDPGTPRQVRQLTGVLRDPQCLRIDAVGNIFAADGISRAIELYDSRLRPIGEIMPPYDGLGLVRGRVAGIAFGLLGELFLSDPTNGRIYRYDASGRFLAAFSGGEEVGWGELLQPMGMAVSHDGTELYVCDPGKRQVMVFDPAGTPLRAFGGTDLQEPVAVAVNRRGQVFVADRKAAALLVFSDQGRLLDTIDGPPTGDARWQGPTDVILQDSSIVVADPPAGRVIIMRAVAP
ncbi:MAG TPA: NHL repeat-containing protein [bacterium]|nr:NHL repeat-containing protein [bacterium]